ncbi:MAG: phosphoribosyl-AMP cyclohydrolase [Bryobacteraceae bacterium]
MELDFEKSGGILPAIVQDWRDGRVLMVGYMNREAFHKTLETGFATFFSRSRNRLWTKGETSGHRLVVRSVQTDCDQDAILLLVEALGPGVCHNGYRSCFYRTWDNGAWRITEPQTYDPEKVY